jgi:hypothetical protein
MASGMDTGSTQGREPFFAWPGAASFKLTIPLSYLFFKIFYSVYFGASLLAKLRRPHPDLYFPWEMRLPFLPSWTLVYLTVPLLLLVSPFILRTWRTFTPFMVTLTVETLVAGVFFLGIPLAQAYPQRVADGFFGSVFHLADRLNLDYNKFPSLHIAFAVTAAIVFGRRCGWLGRTLFSAWTVAVFASDVLIHEHQLLDLAGGLVLGLAGVAIVQRRASDERNLEALRIEALSLSEFWRLARWRVRYLRVFSAFLGASLFRWRQTRPLRVAYCLAQHVDGALDGGRPVPVGNPGGDPHSDPDDREAHVRAILRALAGGKPSTDSAEQLAAFLATSLGEELKAGLSELFEALLEDRRTAASPPLAEHQRKTFFLSLDSAFHLVGVRRRTLLPFPSSSAGTAPGPPRSAVSR